MKGRLNEMKKNTKIAVITFACVIAVGVGITLLIPKTPKNSDMLVSQKTDTEPAKEVTVKINPSTEMPKVYEEITDEKTGETVIAEVQENVPPQEKAEKPKEKPVAKGDYTNPEKPPVYTEEQTVVKETPKQTNVKTGNNTGVSSGAKSTGKVYVDGFGYVDAGGSTVSVTGSSDGDINKMVGVMD